MAWIGESIFECLPYAHEQGSFKKNYRNNFITQSKCWYLLFSQEKKGVESIKHVEHIDKEEKEYLISSFENFYKPHEITAFHELFYFNNLNTNRITNNNPVGSLSGNLMAIFDPFKSKVKKKNSTTNLRYEKYFELNRCVKFVHQMRVWI